MMVGVSDGHSRGQGTILFKTTDYDNEKGTYYYEQVNLKYEI